jgi:uncharacterized protein YkwD
MRSWQRSLERDSSAFIPFQCPSPNVSRTDNHEEPAKIIGTGFIGVALLSLSLSLAQASFAQRAVPPDPDDVTRRVVALTNEFRSQEGRGKVAASEQLAAAARYFADYLGQADQFSHEADGSVAIARAQKHGYDSTCVWENIAHLSGTSAPAPGELAQAFVEGWKKSPRHRQILLEADATETGAAVALGKEGNYYAVQMFGLPASQVIEFRIINRTGSTMGYRLGGETFPLGPMETRTHKQCRTEELMFELPRPARSAAFRPKRGDRFAVVRLESGEFRVVAREK